jgi:hypothetical protein
MHGSFHERAEQANPFGRLSVHGLLESLGQFQGHEIFESVKTKPNSNLFVEAVLE